MRLKTILQLIYEVENPTSPSMITFKKKAEEIIKNHKEKPEEMSRFRRK